LTTQINDQDREHLQAFPPDLKTQVMEKIMSLAPVQNMVYRGNNQFEKAMLNIRREGYGLIDVQPHETAFISVWYRKNGSFLGKGADVTMLLWENGEDSDSTTLMSWKI